MGRIGSGSIFLLDEVAHIISLTDQPIKVYLTGYVLKSNWPG